MLQDSSILPSIRNTKNPASHWLCGICDLRLWYHLESNRTEGNEMIRWIISPRGQTAEVASRTVVTQKPATSGFLWYHLESNQGHQDFQSCALPSELWYQNVKNFFIFKWYWLYSRKTSNRRFDQFFEDPRILQAKFGTSELWYLLK